MKAENEDPAAMPIKETKKEEEEYYEEGKWRSNGLNIV